jgi:hypothetical protein
MKKTLLIVILFFLISIPLITSAAIVPCGNPGEEPCTLNDFFLMLGNIYDFLVKYIAAPLAILAISIGGVLMMISGGNPSLFNRGKQILILSIIGLVLAFGSWLIIETLLRALQYKY